MAKLGVNFCGVEFKNPIALASGTCAFGRELDEAYGIERLGGISTKGLTLRPRYGNEGMRIWETPAGIMNSIGLENPGVQGFIDLHNEWLNSKDVVNIVNLSGHSVEDYSEGIRLLNEVPIDILELNISCPNVKEGGMSFGVKTEVARDLLRVLRPICKNPLVVKLSPNAEDVVALAKMCEDEGADGVSLVNTFLGMAIDIEHKKPVFDNVYAGLSGPCIRPIALRMVHQVARAVKIPVMGLGGIATWKDAVEFLMAGATVLQIGTQSFVDIDTPVKVIEGLNSYLDRQGIEDVNEIIKIV